MCSSNYLTESRMRKLFKGQKFFFPVHSLSCFSSLLLRLVDSCSGQSGEAHTITDEDDDVLGDVGVDVVECGESVVQLFLCKGVPVLLI